MTNVYGNFIVRISLFLFIVFSPQVTFAERGIVVAVNDTYAQKFFIASLDHLRTCIHCDLPIEIWHSGDELSAKTKQILGQFPNVSFHDIAAVLKVDQKVYRGWQIKPWIISLSQFDEVILMDADVFFFENPESLFDHPGYKKTGAFFFCDHRILFPIKNSALLTAKRYLDRRNFITSIVPVPSDCIPSDMQGMWSEKIPTYENPVIGDLGESGCIAIDKKIHAPSLEYTIQLNENHVNTYKYVWGDKETYWMGCEMAGLPYHMNNQRAYELAMRRFRLHITQFVDNKLFYVQKVPFAVNRGSGAIFRNNDGYKQSITNEEMKKINQSVKFVWKHRRKNRSTKV